MTDFKFDGIMPPLTTPFDANDGVDLKTLSRNVGLYNESALAGYVALGSNGEAVHLDDGERARVVETIKRASSPGRVIIAGVNEQSTRAAIRSVRLAAESGADAALVITPYFYKGGMNQNALSRHFSEVADGSPLPILMYNIPQNTGVVLEPSTTAKLAEHPNIVGIKDSSGNMAAMSETIRLAPPGFAIMVGSAPILLSSLVMGATGGILAIACAAPNACIDLFNAFVAGDIARARDLQNRLAPLSHIVTAGLGVPALKAALDLAGYGGCHPRMPLAPIGDPDVARVRNIMIASGLFSGIE